MQEAALGRNPRKSLLTQHVTQNLAWNKKRDEEKRSGGRNTERAPSTFYGKAEETTQRKAAKKDEDGDYRAPQGFQRKLIPSRVTRQTTKKNQASPEHASLPYSTLISLA